MLRVRNGLTGATLDASARAVALLVGFVLVAVTSSPTESAGTALLLVAVAIAMSAWALSGPEGRSGYRYGLIAESVFVTTLVSLGSVAGNLYVVYLAVPPLLAALRRGMLAAAPVVASQIVTLLILWAQTAGTSNSLLSLDLPWVLTGVAFAALGAWVRHLSVGGLGDDSQRSPYASAHRLLTELRGVTRDLSGGLDVETVSASILAEATVTLGGTRAAIQLVGEDGAPAVIAHQGDESLLSEIVDDETVRLAMARHQVVQQALPPEMQPLSWRTALPLLIGSRCIGALVVDSVYSAPPDLLVRAERALDSHAMQLESAAIFADVRSGATVEERSRLAREIHDGIAQEVASLGYFLDDLIGGATDAEQREQLARLRGEVTRVVTELRLSIFDLRSGVSSGEGLGSVLSDYVREIGLSNGMLVHLSLSETQQRLRPDVETELLRIAQEAITNARKHSQAENLWVTCNVEPPFAEVRVEDDGRGRPAHREGHYGLDTMAERAARINAMLTFEERAGGGTCVSVVLMPTETRSSPAATQPTPRTATPDQENSDDLQSAAR